MKALSLMQPWASLMVTRWAVDGGRICKMFETRSRPTNFRGPVAIHASAALTKGGVEAANRSPIREAICYSRRYLLSHGLITLTATELRMMLPLGCVIGIGNLVDCMPVERALEHPKMTFTERHFGDYTAGRFAYLFEDIEAFEVVVPEKGMLGFWEWKRP